jgi:hypothetical protein
MLLGRSILKLNLNWGHRNRSNTEKDGIIIMSDRTKDVRTLRKVNFVPSKFKYILLRTLDIRNCRNIKNYLLFKPEN